MRSPPRPGRPVTVRSRWWGSARRRPAGHHCAPTAGPPPGPEQRRTERPGSPRRSPPAPAEAPPRRPTVSTEPWPQRSLVGTSRAATSTAPRRSSARGAAARSSWPQVPRRAAGEAGRGDRSPCRHLVGRARPRLPCGGIRPGTRPTEPRRLPTEPESRRLGNSIASARGSNERISRRVRCPCRCTRSARSQVLDARFEATRLRPGAVEMQLPVGGGGLRQGGEGQVHTLPGDEPSDEHGPSPLGDAIPRRDQVGVGIEVVEEDVRPRRGPDATPRPEARRVVVLRDDEGGTAGRTHPRRGA